MISVLSDSGLRAAFQEAALTLARGIGADRAAIFYLGQDGRLALGGVHGMPDFSMGVCPISLSVVKDVVSSNRNVVYSNVPSDSDARDNVSLQLSGAVSVLCLPYFDQAGKPAGAMYADTTKKTRAFHRKELLYARDVASWLEGCLAGNDYMPKPEAEPAKVLVSTVLNVATGGRATSARLPGGAERSRRGGLGQTSDLRVTGAPLMVFFRSLATLTRAGVNIDVSLNLLGESSEDANMRKVALGLSEAVFRGEPVSAAMERYPMAFPGQVRSVIRVGERTGRLVRVLDVLASDLEKSQRMVYRVRSALTYPAMLAAACSLMLVLGPPYLLEGHLRVLAESKVPLPWLTQGLLLLSRFMSNPLFLLLLGGGTAATVAYLRSERGHLKLMSWARRTPVIGKILAELSLTQFARSLALQTKAGMTAMEALAQARQGCPDPQLRDAIRQAELGVRNGDTLTEALAGSKFFSKSFLSFIEAGEQTGSLVRLTEWLADFHEQELEASLTGFVALAEPLIMAVMGFATAVLLVATIKPTLLILQTI